MFGRRRRSYLIAVAAVVSAMSLAAPVAQAQDKDEPPSFREFRAATYQDADGVYVVNGDEPVRNLGELRRYYDEMIADDGASKDRLAVNRVYGSDDIWSRSEVGNLTYCVSNAFGSRKSTVVNAMEGGAQNWESASSAINFTYRPAQDGSCTASNNNVTFSVEPSNSNQYIARAFFPSSPKSQRSVVFTDRVFADGSKWPVANVATHELGHVLGFRHEQTRPEAGTCFEDNNWRPLTPYDANSVMHYPQCNGTNERLSFSDFDRQGAPEVYGN